MTEKLRYFLHCGDNRVGRADADSEQSIVIGGLGILKEHCLVTREQKEVPSSPDDNNHHTRDAITIRGLGNARVFVNGNAVSEGTSIELHHCDRLILGNSNVFRVSIIASLFVGFCRSNMGVNVYADCHTFSPYIGANGRNGD